MLKRPQRTPEQQEYRDKLAHNLKQLRDMGEDGKELADALLKREQLTLEYVDSLGKDRKLGHDIAEKLINSAHGNYKYGEYVAKNLNKFEGLDHEKIAEMLIGKGYIESFMENLDNFKGLNYIFLAEKLIEKGYYGCEYLARYINKFKGVDNKEIVKKIINEGYTDFVIKYFGKFTGLDKEILIECIDGKREGDKHDGFARFFQKNDLSIKYDRNIKLDYDIAKHMVKNGMPGLVYCYYKLFDGLTPQNFTRLLLDGYKYTETLEWFLNRYEGELDCEIAKLLIDNGVFSILSRNIGKFNGLNKEIAESLIEKKYSETVLFNLDKFGLNSDDEYKEIIDKILDVDGRIDLCGRKIINDDINIVKKWLDKKLITKLIIKGESSSWGHSWEKLKLIIKENNIQINYVDILEYLIKEHYYRAEEVFIDTFECRNKETVKMLITNRREKCVINNIDKIKGLDKEIAEMLIEKGHIDIVLNNPEKFGLKKEK